MSHGPNVSRLIARRFTQLAVPPDGQLDDALYCLNNESARNALVRQSERWAEDLIAAARSTLPAHFGQDDESIATAILISLRTEDSPFHHLPLPSPEDQGDDYRVDVQR
jgi:hypothetical protein